MIAECPAGEYSPQVFLFDEPLSNLDAKLRVQMRLQIKKLQQRLATTSVYVTHDQVEAMTLADRLVVMNAGIAEQVGTPLEIYARPASEFVAGFIGSPAMNILPATVGEEGHSVTLGDGSVLPLDEPLQHAQPLTPVKLGVRPEHLLLTSDGDASVHIEVDLAEDLGSDTMVHGRLPSTRDNLTVRLSGSHPARPGERLHLKVAAQSLHLFDQDSGKRLQ